MPKNSSTKSLTRRRFVGGTAATAAFTILPSGILRGDDPKPGEKLNIAFIGMGGQIQGHVSKTLQLKHNVIALCDVDEGQISQSRKRHGEGVSKAASYADYRVLFDKEKSIDAVVIATPDHWHSPICKAAMSAGKHVYCEKPLTHTVAEARELRELSRKSKVITQTGNQGSASPNLRRSIELIQAGLFGQIKSIHIWHPKHGWPSGVNRPEGEDKIPAGLNWDFWLGTAPVRPFKSGIYHPAKWRGWYDFGNGSLGDFCCHSFNMPVRALELDYPEKIDVSGKELGKESFAESCTVSYAFPKRGNRGPVQLHFYTGGDLPPDEVNQHLIGSFGSIPRVGCVLVGEKGLLSSGLWNSQCYVKLNGENKFVGHGNHEEAKEVPESLPRSPGHFEEWTRACQGGPPTFANFDLGGHLTELGLAGIVALRLQKNIDWDGPNMKAKGVPEADQFVRKENRSKWL